MQEAKLIEEGGGEGGRERGGRGDEWSVLKNCYKLRPKHSEDRLA